MRIRSSILESMIERFSYVKMLRGSLTTDTLEKTFLKKTSVSK